METGAYLTSITAGIFYLIASARLLRLHLRTGERPELLLGIYFAVSGQWYVLYNGPYFFGLEGLPPSIESAVEWVYAIGVVPYLLFIRRVFRAEAAWATALVIVSSLFLLAGSVIASLGDGFSNSTADPSYLIEWVGYTVPCIWMCCEGAIAHATAKRRVRIGLCDPVVANRYLLFAGFGFFQSAASLSDLGWAFGNSSAEAAESTLAFGLLGGTEVASVALLWLAFFPPRRFANWIERRASIPTTTEAR